MARHRRVFERERVARIEVARAPRVGRIGAARGHALVAAGRLALAARRRCATTSPCRILPLHSARSQGPSDRFAGRLSSPGSEGAVALRRHRTPRSPPAPDASAAGGFRRGGSAPRRDLSKAGIGTRCGLTPAPAAATAAGTAPDRRRRIPPRRVSPTPRFVQARNRNKVWPDAGTSRGHRRRHRTRAPQEDSAAAGQPHAAICPAPDRNKVWPDAGIRRGHRRRHQHAGAEEFRRGGSAPRRDLSRPGSEQGVA